MRSTHRIALIISRRGYLAGRPPGFGGAKPQGGPREHNDPPGYQSREALRVKQQRPAGRFVDVTKRSTYEEQQDFNIVMVGSPETVTRKLTQTIEKLNPGYLRIYGNEGAMPHVDTMRSIELGYPLCTRSSYNLRVGRGLAGAGPRINPFARIVRRDRQSLMHDHL